MRDDSAPDRGDAPDRPEGDELEAPGDELETGALGAGTLGVLTLEDVVIDGCDDRDDAPVTDVDGAAEASVATASRPKESSRQVFARSRVMAIGPWGGPYAHGVPNPGDAKVTKIGRLRNARGPSWRARGVPKDNPF